MCREIFGYVGLRVCILRYLQWSTILAQLGSFILSVALVFSAGFNDLRQSCLPSSQDFAHHIVAAKRKPDPLRGTLTSKSST